MNSRDQKLKMRVDKLCVVSQFDESIERKITYAKLKKMIQGIQTISRSIYPKQRRKTLPKSIID
jgi:hypothetical protein